MKGKYRFSRKYVCPREFLYLVVMDSKEKKAWKVCNTLWSNDVMSNINSYIKNLIGDCLFCLKLQAIGSSSKEEPIYFSIQSYQLISSFLQTGTCSNIDIVLQNIWNLYSVVIHELNRSYDYMECISLKNLESFVQLG